MAMDMDMDTDMDMDMDTHTDADIKTVAARERGHEPAGEKRTVATDRRRQCYTFIAIQPTLAHSVFAFRVARMSIRR